MCTRKGDQGDTDTGLRERVGKDSPLIDVEGTVDELNSFIGMAYVKTGWEDIRNDLNSVQIDVFTLGEHITAKGTRRRMTGERTEWLEERIRTYRTELGPLRLFVVPGGSEQSASLHIARTVCRRLERIIVRASRELEINQEILTYMNRLSSLLFILANVSNKRQGITERIWDIRPRS